MLFFWLKWAAYIIGGWTAVSVTASLAFGLLINYDKRRLKEAEQRRRMTPVGLPPMETVHFIAVQPRRPESGRYGHDALLEQERRRDSDAPISPHLPRRSTIPVPMDESSPY